VIDIRNDAEAAGEIRPIPPYGPCGWPEGMQRRQVKATSDDGRERHNPGRRSLIFKELGDVRHSHLADPLLFAFAGLAIGAASPHTTPRNPLTSTLSGASTRARLPLER
jgi:tRNA 2-thiocytidine biosynthesis protein TtcA